MSTLQHFSKAYFMDWSWYYRITRSKYNPLAATMVFLANAVGTKTHRLGSPKLKVGQWYEMDYRFLHCCFNEFQRFVEQDYCPYLNAVYDLYVDKKLNVTQCLYLIDHEHNLALKEQPLLPEGSEPHQEWQRRLSDNREMVRLYVWWITRRAGRKQIRESHENLCPERDDDQHNFGLGCDLCAIYYRSVHRIEEDLYEADTNALVSLMRIRSSLVGW